jgi:hypothetical protein
VLTIAGGILLAEAITGAIGVIVATVMWLIMMRPSPKPRPPRSLGH